MPIILYDPQWSIFPRGNNLPQKKTPAQTIFATNHQLSVGQQLNPDGLRAMCEKLGQGLESHGVGWGPIAIGLTISMTIRPSTIAF